MASVSTQRTIIFFHSNTLNFPQNLPSCDPSLYFLQRDYFHTPEIVLTIQVLWFSPTRTASMWPFTLVFPKDLFPHSGQNTWPLLWVLHWETSFLFPWIICCWHFRLLLSLHQLCSLHKIHKFFHSRIPSFRAELFFIRWKTWNRFI